MVKRGYITLRLLSLLRCSVSQSAPAWTPSKSDGFCYIVGKTSIINEMEITNIAYSHSADERNIQ